MMDLKEAGMRYGGLPVALSGIILILLSGELIPAWDIMDGERLSDLALRGGFGLFLMGLLLLFLFSFKTVPREISTSFILSQGRNSGRLVQAMNLKGKGVLYPPVGRLREDRVYIPLEKHDLPLPDISDETVFNVGSTGPSMGISMIPPGKGFVDKVEELSNHSFSEDPIRDGSESMERLSKGTGMFKKIELRDNGNKITLRIHHSTGSEACDAIWKEFPNLHSQTGCPLCSAVLCATARIGSVPLRIEKAERNDDIVEYTLRRKLK
jgi:hypothetical protein